MYLEYLVAAVSFLLIWILLHNYFPSRKHPPGPFRLPILGNALNCFIEGSIPPFVLFRNMSRKYGPISYFKMGARPTVIIDDFDTAKAMLNNELWVDRPFNELFAERSYGKPLGIIFVGGEGWREMRRFSMRTLRDFGYGKQTSMHLAIEDEAKELLAKLEQVASGKDGILKVKHLFTMPVLNILWGMVSNVRTPEDDVKLKRLVLLVDNLAKATPMAGSILDLFPVFRHVAPGLLGLTFVRKCVAELQAYFKELLEMRRKEGGYKEDNRDFIDMFIKEIDKHKELGSNPNHYTDEQFITTITDLFEAGSETSSNTLEFAIYYVMKNPEVQKKIQEEIDRVVGRSRLPNTGDRPEMPYTEAALIETQRLSNVLPITARCPTQDCKINEYDIEKDTIGIVNIYSIHMDDKFWGDPWNFRPERFLTKDNKIIAEKANRVIPFGAGKRVCLGEQMARTTLFTYFTAVLQNYNFEECPETKNDMMTSSQENPESVIFKKEVHVGFTLSPYPYQAKITKRH